MNKTTPRHLTQTRSPEYLSKPVRAALLNLRLHLLTVTAPLKAEDQTRLLLALAAEIADTLEALATSP